LADLFPHSNHVEPAGLGAAKDMAVWEYAKNGGYTIVSKDSDFIDLATVKGPPPKVVAVTLGNCSTRQVESLLRMKTQAIIAFERNPEDGILVLP
jgi:predicted nuclease of predicted toxin-antitoxin system